MRTSPPVGRAVLSVVTAFAATLVLAGPAVATPSPGFDSQIGYGLLGGDDVGAQIVLPFAVSLFGQSYSVMNVSSNGFATFTDVAGLPGFTLGDDPWNPTVASFLNGPSRIAPEWFDWVSSVSYLATSDRILLTWEGNKYGQSDTYRAQAQIYADGLIAFAYDTPHAPNGLALAGITAGGGVADPGSTNFTAASLSVSGAQAIYMGGGPGLFANAISVTFTPDGNGGYRVEGDVPPLPGPVDGGGGTGGGPVSPAPEPAAWTLMILGFGLSGAAMRRRRPTAA